MDQHRAPLFEAMAKHHKRKTASFHVPGHKSGLGVDDEAAAFLAPVMAIDYTEIAGLDDLHQPDGAIKEAQELAAACFGAEETRFLVGGSTVGNLALITALCRRGDLLIVQRNVHKSVLHGLMLAGAKAVFLTPRWDEDVQLAAGVRSEDVAQALETYPQAKGVMLTNPNYYGMSIDLASIADIAHRAGKPLLVDEAHGAHFGFHPDLPASALSSGADAVVQSTHKMLSAMTMGAMLHMQGERLVRQAVRQRLAMLQSSSPSYPLMASLDLARRQIALQGRETIESALERIAKLRVKIEELGCYELVGHSERDGSQAYDSLDPFKLTLSDRTGILNGFGLQAELDRDGCMAELAGLRHVLLVFSPVSDSQDYERLISSLRNIAVRYRLFERTASQAERTTAGFDTNGADSISEPVSFELPSHEHALPIKRIPLADAVGRIAAEMVIPYPPGIPQLYPGERITEGCVRQLLHLARFGARFQGVEDATMQSIGIYGPNN